MSALFIRALSLFVAGDYVRSRAVAERLLARLPDNRSARIIISANNGMLGEYSGTLNVLDPLLKSIDTLDARTRAVVRNNAAHSLAMSALVTRSPDEDALRRAEQHSAEAFATYPCVLAYRNTRALVLALRGHFSEALALLEYRHYESGSPIERANREFVRAYALHESGRAEEATAAANAAVALNPMMDRVLSSIRPSG